MNNAEKINFSIDLEDTLEDNKAPFISVLNQFVENNHPEVLEQRGEKYASDQIQNWGFEPFTEDISEARNWDSREEKDNVLFIFGEHLFYDDSELEQAKEDYGSIWLGFQEVMNNVFKGNPSNFPIYDENTSKYFEELRNEFPESKIDIVTSRNDNKAVLNRPEGYPISDDLLEGVEEYLQIHELDEAADELVIASDKADHENNYTVFFDDKPDLDEELGKGQYQVVHTTQANDNLEIPTYQEILNGEASLDENNQIRVYEVEEGFQAMSYIGTQIKENAI